MITGGTRVSRAGEGNDDGLALSCTAEGLFLGRTALIERRGDGYVLRPPAELERLFGRAYGGHVTVDRLMPGFTAVAGALGIKNIGLAQIAAANLALPDLPGVVARIGVELENLLIKLERIDGQLARVPWDEAKHPRTGTPPNPGWFAPSGGSGTAPARRQVAAGEREERGPEEEPDPLGEVRQALWEAGIATLRRIDPNNPYLTYFANPGAAPNQAALDRLHDVVKTAATRRIMDKVSPRGVPIGRPGRSLDVRELPGGLTAAKDLFDYLRLGGMTHRFDENLSVARLPSEAGFVTLRAISRSGSPAVDINLLDAPFFMRFHFP